MSMNEKTTITCPYCKAEGDFEMWKSVNIQLNPELKEKILNMEIFTYKCPKCGKEASVAYPLLYHDMSKQIMIYLVNNDEESIENTAKILSGEGMESFEDFGDFSKEYTSRIVTSPLDLREKISIFDAGLDDRIIELAKLFYAGMAIEQFPDNRIHEVQFGTDENGSSYLAFIDENGVFANAELSEELYDDTKKLFEEKIKNPVSENFVYDVNWAHNLFGENDE